MIRIHVTVGAVNENSLVAGLERGWDKKLSLYAEPLKQVSFVRRFCSLSGLV